MTDITELAQSLKAAAENAGIEQWVNNRGEANTADYEVDGGMYIDHICDCEIVGTESPCAEFIALANPANVLALVEALEKAQQRNAELEFQLKSVENNEIDARCHIAELESRTVKLPDFRHERFNSDWGEHDAEAYQVALREALTAAGIKVEAE